jgi:hypothetical protein
MVLTEMSLDYSNRVLGSQKDNVKQMDKEETQQKENMLFSSQEYAAKLQKAFPLHFNLVESWHIIFFF